MNAPTPDFAAIKTRQQAAWGSGDYAVIGTTLQIVGESLAEAADVRAGDRVLDVAAGNGNATLAAARRFAEVTSTLTGTVRPSLMSSVVFTLEAYIFLYPSCNVANSRFRCSTVPMHDGGVHHRNG